MLAVIIISVLLLSAYTALIAYYCNGWTQLPEFIPGATDARVKISVIIAARNEGPAIGSLLHALARQSYSPEWYEIIVIDDHSEDDTAARVQEFEKIKLIRLKEHTAAYGKKKAIETGIRYATGDLIVTTDADCIPGENWLATIAAFKQETQAVFIAAPVVFRNNTRFLELFQTLDFLTLQGITGASVYKKFHNMCNGANLAYDKNVFVEVNGFEHISHIASGDDMLLMHKIAERYPDRIRYLKNKEAMMETLPQSTWTAFLNQRRRWASKAVFYKDKRVSYVLLLVYLVNLLFPILLILGLAVNTAFLYLLGALLVAKTAIEYRFVKMVAGYFSKNQLMKYFIWMQPFHIFYTVVSGWLGQAGRYHWKGRKVK